MADEMADLKEENRLLRLALYDLLNCDEPMLNWLKSWACARGWNGKFPSWLRTNAEAKAKVRSALEIGRKRCMDEALAYFDQFKEKKP